MGDFGRDVGRAGNFAQAMAQFATAIWVAAFLVTMAAAVWICMDAEARGESGIAAALIVLLSVFYGIPFTFIVVCTWILIRPDKASRGTMESQDGLPETLPSGIVAEATPEEFLEGLEEET